MVKKRVLVTGANGYIGRHVVEHLLNKDCEVFAADLFFDGVDKRAHQIQIDIFSGKEHIFEELGKPDICIHLAWRNGFIHNSESHIIDLPKHYMFLKNMIEDGLQQLVVMGSMHEVGYWEGAVDEDTPTNPLSLYAIAKNSLRQMMEIVAEQYNIVLQWTRGFYIVGDDLKGNSIFSKIMQASEEGKTLFPFTSGKNKYDFISMEQFAEQISCVALQAEERGIINCCTGTPVSLAERVEQFIAENKLSIALDYGAYPDRKYDSPGIWGNPETINKIMDKETY